MYKRSIALIFLLTLVVAFVPARNSHSQGLKPIGIVTAVDGRASVNGPRGIEELAVGSALYLGDTLTTQSASGIKILLDDDTLITLGENAEFELTEFIYTPQENRSTVFSLLKGTLKALVEKLGGGTSKVEFVTPRGIAGIKGTTLYLDADNGIFYVLEGEAIVKGIVPGAREIRLDSGEFTTILPDGSPASPAPIPQDLRDKFEAETGVQASLPNVGGGTGGGLPGTAAAPPLPVLASSALNGVTTLPLAQPINLLPGTNELDQAPVEIIVLPPPSR